MQQQTRTLRLALYTKAHSNDSVYGTPRTRYKLPPKHSPLVLVPEKVKWKQAGGSTLSDYQNYRHILIYGLIKGSSIY
jgi:hypothetical protein